MALLQTVCTRTGTHVFSIESHLNFFTAYKNGKALYYVLRINIRVSRVSNHCGLLIGKKLQLPTHPSKNTKQQNPAQNRLKRTSFNHLSKSLSRQSDNCLPASSTEMEMLPDLLEPDDHLEAPVEKKAGYTDWC